MFCLSAKKWRCNTVFGSSGVVASSQELWTDALLLSVRSEGLRPLCQGVARVGFSARKSGIKGRWGTTHLSKISRSGDSTQGKLIQSSLSRPVVMRQG